MHVPRDELGNEAVQMLQQRLIRPDAPVGSLLLHGRLAVRGVSAAGSPEEREHRRGTEGLYDTQLSIPNARLP